MRYAIQALEKPSAPEDRCIRPYKVICGSACSVMVIVVGNGHGDTSSNPGRD